MRLPFSDAMMARLRQILGAEVAAGLPDRREPSIVATSLPVPEAEELKNRLAHGPLPRRVNLAGNAYLVGEAAAADTGPGRGADEHVRLYVLVPEAEVEAAKVASTHTILLITFAAIALASLVGFWLSTTITRPIRRLAGRMDRLADHAADDAVSLKLGSAEARGPTEVVRLERSFDRLLERLEEARRQLARSARLATVGQLAASVAHELRNPLSGVKMNAQVLADELAHKGIHDSGLDRIIRETDRMNLYLEELLGLAGGAADDERPHDLKRLPHVHLDEVGDSVVTLLAGRCRHGGVEVRCRWDADAVRVRAEETQVRQVILNLVLNALEAMPAGGTVTLSNRAADEGAVRFSVADTGKGMRASDGSDVFDPFVTTKPGGVGLGLYICRRNVERHGGRIGYDSSDDGATFWFELPAADLSAEVPARRSGTKAD
jgi:signal transduction histidine kinase